MQLKAQSLVNMREPYAKGPHIKYFVKAIVIALVISTLMMGGLMRILRWVVG